MNKFLKDETRELAKEAVAYPQESLLKEVEKNKTLSIGIPKETSPFENRVPLTPESISLLVQNGHEIKIETGAGNRAKFSDRSYSESGAQIVYSPHEAYQTDVILKIQPPSIEEIELIKKGKTLISTIQLAELCPEYIDALNSNHVTALGFEFIEDKLGGKPIVRAMSEIAGSTVMLIASEYLNSNNNGRGVILGGITGVPPIQVVILGAGTVAEYAARTALGLGAEVKIFDNHIYKLRRIKQLLNHHIYTSTIDAVTIHDAIKKADVIVGALRAEEDRSPCVVNEELICGMKPNSIIIDVSIDQGGCFETSQATTHKNPIFVKHDVIHYCVPNIASRVAQTATTALSNILTPILLQTDKYGGIEELIYAKEWFQKGVYTYKGSLTNKKVAKRFNMKYKDMRLYTAARTSF